MVMKENNRSRKKGKCAYTGGSSIHPGVCFEPLEPRLLLSGSWGAGVDAPSHDSQTSTHGGFTQETVVISEITVGSGTDTQHQNPRQTAVHVDLLAQAPVLNAVNAADPVLEAPSTADLVAPATGDTPAKGSESDSETQPDLMAAAGIHELVFVNENIADYQQLIADLQGGNDNRVIEVVILDADRDGIEQVSEIMADRSDLAAVHFITHGTDGQVNLGNIWLNSATLQQNSAAVTGWGDSLSETGDILFYGCNIAADSVGQGLLNSIADLTGADVAASDDLTGSARSGGDWVLEFSKGAIDTDVAFRPQAQQNWSGVLATFTVNTTADSGPGSLRQAIIAANANGMGIDTIAFNIAGAGPHTIVVNSELPQIITPMVIDGALQPGYSGKPLIQIDRGASALNADGLTLAGGSDGSTIRGLSITGFTSGGDKGEAIDIRSDNNTIVGNYLGVAPDGDTVVENRAGINLSGGASYNTIGGTTSADRNVISGNVYAGVDIYNFNTDRNRVIGNYIGLNADGDTVLTSGTFGVLVWDQANNNIVGGKDPGEGNRIAGYREGVVVDNTASNTPIIGNEIFQNREMGIDLNNDQVTYNDADDSDSGPNDLLNYPVITAVQQSGGDLDVVFSLDLPAGDYRIEFFENPNGIDDTGYGEGELFLGFVDVTSNGIGSQTFAETLVGVTATNTATVVATATEDLGGGFFGSTSEFSPTTPTDATILDQFNTIAYDGNDGTVPWSNDWQEFGEADGANSGNVAVDTRLLEQGLWLSDDGNGAWRQADLSGVTTAILSFEYALIKVDAGEYAVLEISDNGGGSWAELDRFEGPADQSALILVSYDITPYAASDTQIQFRLFNFNGNDEFLVDNVQIAISYAGGSLAAVDEFRVNDDTETGRQETSGDVDHSQRAVALANDGSYVVVWSSEGQDAVGWGVYAQRFDKYGNELTGEILVNEIESGNEQWARVVCDSNGDFVVTWTSDHDGSKDVYARRFSSAGTPLAGEFRVNTTTANDQQDSSIAIDASGNFIVVWEGQGIVDSAGVYYRRYNANGTFMDATEQRANLTDIGTERDASVAMNAAGDFVVVWEVGGSIKFQMFASDGTPGTAKTVYIDNVSSKPDVAMDALGNFVVVYRWDGAFGRGVWGHQFDNSGVEVAPWFRVGPGNDVVYKDHDKPSIAMDDAGNFIVTYESIADGGPGKTVFAARFQSDTTSLGEFQVNQTTAGNQHMASIAMSDLDNYVVVFTGEDADQTGVYARQYGVVPVVNNPGTVTIDNVTPSQGDTLTANVIDPDGATGVISYQWYRDGGVITGAMGASYTTTQADVGAVITVTADYTDDYGTVESLISEGTLAVVNLNDAPVGLPVITGTVTEDQTLTADTSGISDADGLGGFSYQWLRNGAVIVGATSSTYTLGDADVGNLISVQVSYTDGQSTPETLTSAQTAAVVNLNDAPVGLPVITGTVTEDQTLTADTSGISDADGLGGFSYQWLRNGAVIVGATSSTYTLGDADVGNLISVQVSYTDGQSTPETLTSAQTAAVVNLNDAPVGLPVITGTVTEDQTLTADTSGISDADGLGGFSYQWLRNGAVIVGATSSTYTLGDADVGNLISVQVSYTDGQSTPETLTSAQTAAVVNLNDAPVGLPVITGTVTEDQTLTADTSGISDADGLGGFSYQWLRNGAVIVGATSSTYTLGDADVGNLISVQVSYTDGQSTPETLTSAQTAAVVNLNDAPVGLPVITGTVTEDQTLTADTSGISDADGLGGFSYQWLRNGAVIVGATSSTYTLGDADVGNLISVQVSYTDGQSTPETLTSAQTAAVVNLNDAPVGLPVITGTVTEDQTLTADTSGISDADGLGGFSYQWLRNGAVIVGATSSTYTLGDADVGNLISVQVSYTDGQSTPETLTSAQTAAVVNLNDAPVGLPVITGTVTEDQTLTADTSGISDADGLGGFSYQWLRNGAVIVGATSSTYTLGDADVGNLISVQVSYTDGQSTPETLTSAQTAAVVNLNDAPVGLPVITGTVTEDQTLTADTSGISDADGLGGFSYQWLRNGAVIVGATSSTYTLGDADVGNLISVQVSYTDGQSTPETLTSAQTAAVVNLNDAPVGLPVITGTVTEDQTLTADTSGISDADGLGAFSYQWLRNGAVIVGATSSTYTLGDADVGTLISVQVSATPTVRARPRR